MQEATEQVLQMQGNTALRLGVSLQERLEIFLPALESLYETSQKSWVELIDIGEDPFTAKNNRWVYTMKRSDLPPVIEELKILFGGKNEL
jgi:hypothetical protein